MTRNKIFAFCLGFLFLGTACSSSLTTVGNPRGAQINVSLADNVGASGGEALKKAAVSGGEYTPDVYILGIRHLSLVRCTDSSGSDMECLGERGEEVDQFLGAGEAMAAATLNSALLSDQIIYAAPASEVDDSVGTSETISTDLIEEAGLYSAARLGIDFLITAFPSSESDANVPESADGFEFALLCLNEGGCSTTLEGYTASYLSGLGEGEVEAGEIVFFNSRDGIWYWWDLNGENFASLSEGRPSNLLTQTSVLDELTRGDNGEWVYNSSFGSTTDDGLVPLNITEALIDSGASDTLTMTFSVERSMSFDDDDDDNTLDASEMESFAFGKPRITSLETTENTFSTE